MRSILLIGALLAGLAGPARADFLELIPALVSRVETVAITNISVPSGATTIGGITINSANRCALLVAQTTPTENGIYCYNSTAWHTKYMIEAGWLAVLVLRGTGGGKMCTSADYAQVGMSSTWACMDIRPRYTSGILTGTGAEQSIAHGFGYTPTKFHASIVGLPAGLSFLSANNITMGTHDATNIKITVPNGFLYMVEAE